MELQPVPIAEDNYLANPLPENEFVGTDEVGMYLEKEPIAVEVGEEDHVPEQDSESDSEVQVENEEEEEVEEDSIEKDSLAGHVDYDKEDPPMNVSTIYPNIEEFKLALAQHAIKHEFSYNIEKSDKGRFRAYCSRQLEDSCLWGVHASATEDGETIKVRMNPSKHSCSSTRRDKRVKNASKHWICDKVKDWLIEDPSLGAKALRQKLKEHHKVKINYKRVYMGKELAIRQLFGNWDSSFDNLYRFKAEIERSSPGSLVIIDNHTINGKIRFRRLFFALKPCIDGFVWGCRPYLVVDSTFLTGKFKGQLATASAVDGHNWLYPVAFGVMDSETMRIGFGSCKCLKKSLDHQEV